LSAPRGEKIPPDFPTFLREVGKHVASFMPEFGHAYLIGCIEKTLERISRDHAGD
jgi:hypothetical protein